MYSYLSRSETYYDEKNPEACGTISFLLWGGLAGKRWAESKLKELGKIELKEGVPHYTADGKLYDRANPHGRWQAYDRRRAYRRKRIPIS
jgi:hypothetical protein